MTQPKLTTVESNEPRASLAWLCEICGDPTSLVHITDDGDKACSDCTLTQAVEEEALREYRRQLKSREIHNRLVLAREGIAGYGRAPHTEPPRRVQRWAPEFPDAGEWEVGK